MSSFHGGALVCSSLSITFVPQGCEGIAGFLAMYYTPRSFFVNFNFVKENKGQDLEKEIRKETFVPRFSLLAKNANTGMENQNSPRTVI